MLFAVHYLHDNVQRAMFIDAESSQQARERFSHDNKDKGYIIRKVKIAQAQPAPATDVE